MIYFAKWKIILVIGICLLGVVYAAPNVMDRQDDALDDISALVPHKQINLGLDLRGGSHLLMQVEVDAVIRERLQDLVDEVRATLRKERIRYQGLGAAAGGVGVTIIDADQLDDARKKLAALDSDFLTTTGEAGRITMALAEKALIARRTQAIEQSIEIVRRRIDETGVREPTIQRQGDDRILLQLPGVDDPQRLKSLLGQTARLTFHLLDESIAAEQAAATGRVPAGARLLYGNEVNPATGQAQPYLVKRKVEVSGEALTNASPGVDSRSNQPVVNFRFDAGGAKKFGEITAANVNRPFAIVLDDKVISAPVIREPILGGSGQISGRFTVAEANDLALLLRAGALPAPLTILEERTVGPGLGQDSIEAGQIASVIGLIAVVVFMVLAYGKFGVMADIALVFNMILIIAALSVLQATLTLPGIAGIVLTIGMAVDANVLIFERIREEVKLGRTPISAVDAGYSRALSTIVDANVTTLIAAVLLYAFGSGPVRGFAVTLAIGIVTSMFTAIMVTRLMVVFWLRKTRPTKLSI
ncbi:MAG: protein translocase subunit SecD [Rhodospirillales bacterium]